MDGDSPSRTPASTAAARVTSHRAGNHDERHGNTRDLRLLVQLVRAALWARAIISHRDSVPCHRTN